jgi:peptidoglycan/xylan/chitin deacetylase (PgdA/CDA1 family)
MAGIPILLYHSISAQASPRFRPWTVAPGVFAEHMQLLADLGYEAVTVSRLGRALEGVSPVPTRPVAVTFDDGYADFHDAALPALDAHRFTATLYVTTGHVGGTAQWLAQDDEADRRMLDWAQLHEIAAKGIEVGAHSHTHPRLDELRSADSLAEIRDSRRILEDRLQRPVTSFAYPHGYHGPRVRQQVIDAGFATAAAVKNAMSSLADDRFALARIVVAHGTSTDDLRRLLQGVSLEQAPTPTRLRTVGWRIFRRGRARAAEALHGSRARCL